MYAPIRELGDMPDGVAYRGEGVKLAVTVT
jgi:hypothetical protein